MTLKVFEASWNFGLHPWSSWSSSSSSLSTGFLFFLPPLELLNVLRRW
jgi:hypothetical protein